MFNLISSLIPGSGVLSNFANIFQQQFTQRMGSMQGNYGQLQGLQDLRSATNMTDMTQLANEQLQDHNMAMKSQQTENEIRRIGQTTALSTLKLFAQAASQASIKTAEGIKEATR